MPDRSCVGVEYFCSVGDDLWRRSDAELVALAARRARARLGLSGGQRVVAGHVVRMRDAYPVYDAHHRSRTSTTIRRGLAAIANLHVAGRNGMHRYDNMDHSILTGLLAARNVLGGSPRPLVGERRRRVPRAVGRGTARCARHLTGCASLRSAHQRSLFDLQNQLNCRGARGSVAS